MARPAQSHDNTEVRQYLIDKLQMDYGFRYELPGWLDDVLTGAGRLNGSLRSNTKPVSKRVRHCCKVSDEAAFCLIQRPYISKTLLTRRISPRGSP